MSQSEYLVQIIHRRDGRVAQWAPGLDIETEFIENLCNRVLAKGVGMLRSEKRVIEAVRQAAQELLFDLKAQV